MIKNQTLPSEPNGPAVVKYDNPKHTPGPWSYRQESADPEWWIVTIKGGLIVANVNAHFFQEANARVIAAAPDMLDALDHIIADLEMAHPNIKLPAPAEARIRAAVAKANRGVP